MRSPAFRELFDAHAPFVLDRQLLFEKRVAGQAWRADVEAGTLEVGSLVARAEVLATYSNASGTFLWSWARAAELGTGWPARATAAAGRVRALGSDVPELSEGMLAMSAEDADDVVLVALGLLGRDGYAAGRPLSFRGDHEHGSVYLVLDAPDLVEPVDCAARRVVALFPQLLAMGVPIEKPRAAFVAYCRAHGMRIVESHDTVRSEDATGSSVTARFDATGQLGAIDAQIAEPGKPG